jgi:hypothetical protein
VGKPRRELGSSETAPSAAAPAFVPLAGDWALWPVAALRAPAVPAAEVLALAAPDPAGADGSALERVVQDDWFLTAVAWQNPGLLENWLGAYVRCLRAGDRSLRRSAYRESVLALYLQRFATRNDTIGSFGPVSWARVEPAASVVVAAADRPRLLRRSVHFEAWAIEQLARAWEADPDVRRHLRPRPNPAAVLVGRTFRRSRGRPLVLTDEEAAIVASCDGSLNAEELARNLCRGPRCGHARDPEDVLAVLSRLARRGLIVWSFDLPFDERMEESLAAELELVPDRAGRTYEASLQELIERRDAVVRSWDDPYALNAALRRLEASFEAISGRRPRHTKTDREVGRAIVWPEELAAWDAILGAPALEALGPPLELLLCACRWLTWRVASRLRALAAGVLAERPPISLGALLVELTPELRPATSSILRLALDELQDAIRAIVDVDASKTRVDYDIAEVAGSWRAAFDAPGPGWEAARVHSPDVMLARTSADDARASESRWVLGEFHVGVNTLENRNRVTNEERPGEIERLVAATFPRVRLVPAFGRSWPELTQRTYPPLAVHLENTYVYWALESRDTLPASFARVPVADLEVVQDAEGVPIVRSTSGRAPTAALTEYLGELLSFLLAHSFRPFALRDRLPRISLGALVVQRQAWQVPMVDLTRAADVSAALAARGVPRFSFVRLSGQRKPVFCDRESPALLHAIARLARRGVDEGAAARVEEMLPAFDDLWLGRDGDGARTAEFRLVCVDGRPASTTLTSPSSGR